MRDPLAFAVLLCALTLAACGTRGPLTLPPPVKPVPASTTSPGAPAAAADLNTAKDPAR